MDDRHAVDRAARGRLGRRVDRVVGADHEGDVGGRHLGVGLVHLLELVVGHVGLGQEHVHVPGHAAGHRVDGEEGLDAARGEGVGQLAHGVLGLGHGEAVAGDDDDLAGVGQQHADVLGRAGAHRAGRVALLAAGGGDDRAERAEEDVGQRAAHGRAHQPGQDDARGADQGAGHDQQVVVEHEARGGHGQAGERVQQRDEHRHVGAADGQHEDHAEHERQHQDDPDVDDAPGDQRQDDHGADGHADQRVDHLLARVGDGPPGDQLLQLDERDRAPRERHRPDEHAEQHLGRDVDRRLAARASAGAAARRWRSAPPRRRPHR